MKTIYRPYTDEELLQLMRTKAEFTRKDGWLFITSLVFGMTEPTKVVLTTGEYLIIVDPQYLLEHYTVNGIKDFAGVVIVKEERQ